LQTDIYFPSSFTQVTNKMHISGHICYGMDVMGEGTHACM
jgi:hypothetical protein